MSRRMYPAKKSLSATHPKNPKGASKTTQAGPRGYLFKQMLMP